VYGCDATATYARADWIGLALAALDQAGVTPRQLHDAYKASRNGETDDVLWQLDEGPEPERPGV
jgi:hypothetical protein